MDAERAKIILLSCKCVQEEDITILTPQEMHLGLEVQDIKCDIAIMDIEYENRQFNGITLSKELNKKLPLCQIIYLTWVLEFAPEALFHELHPEIASFDYSWSIVNDPKKTDYVGAELKNIVASHSNIALDEINTVIEYEEMTNSFAFGSMEILSWLVFLFGVINLINTTLSNQIARKQENSILRSIGLTQKQLCKMNICEGLCYALFATLATLIVGLPASIFACRKMSIGAFAGNVVPYKFPVLEMGLFILVLFGMELILSVWTIRRQKKQSLIEQMRAME